MRSTLAERIRVASGEGQADLLIRNGRVVDVFSGQIERKDVAIYGGTIIGFGDYQAKKTIDVEGQFLCPGSSMAMFMSNRAWSPFLILPGPSSPGGPPPW